MVIPPQLWPPTDQPAILGRQVWDSNTATGLPGVAKALGVYTGALSQMPLDVYRGTSRLTPRPVLWQLPDPALRTRATWISVQVQEWWVHGNTVSLITSRNADGSTASTKWFPAQAWWLAGPDVTDDGGVDYYLHGKLVARRDVLHAQRGAHPLQPWRGIGVLEQHLSHLDGIGLQAASERKNLEQGGVPSVAVIAPNPDLSPEEANEVAAKMEEKFAGPGRRPGVFGAGTQVIPLSWSATDAQMVEAQQLSLTHIANMFNLDPTWLGAPNGSHNYKSPGPLFLALLKLSLEPVMSVFEQLWSNVLLPYGQDVRFDRNALTRDDFASMVATLATATGGKPLLTREEARVYAGLPQDPELGEFPAMPDALDTTDTGAGEGQPAALVAVPDPDDSTNDSTDEQETA